MEQSTSDMESLLSALNKLTDSEVNIKDDKEKCEGESRELTLYSKRIIIEDKFTGKQLFYEPNTTPLCELYNFEENLYECVLAPTRVYIAREKTSGKQVAIKETTKLKIKNHQLLEFIYNEVVITRYLSKYLNSVVQVYDYYENEHTINMVMELCDRPNFFDELLENVSYIK